MSEGQAKRGPGRPPRSEQIRRERRRRDTEIDGYRMRLSIPEKYRKDAEHEYRWINDDKSRIAALTEQDDWDLVKADDIESHAGSDTVCRQVGTKANGEPLFAYLARKPKEFCEEDRAKKQRSLDETMDQLAAGRRGDPVNMGGEAGYVATDTHVRDGRRKS